MAEHAEFMKRAVKLAGTALGGVSPRPPVAAVIVKDGRVISEGVTEPRPGLHAEPIAISRAGQSSRGATMYVTLEPHAHHSAAPPCTEAIINAGIATVFCPIEDPNPMVSGNGFRQLKAAGIEVHVGGEPELIEAAAELIEGFAKWITARRPFVTAKFAMSLDGKIATRAGESQWITGEAARREAHSLRARSDAVMVGIGTVLVDDPRLTARGEGVPSGRPLLRVVIDSNGRLPRSARLLREPGRVLWVRCSDTGVAGPTSGNEDLSADVEAVDLSRRNGHVDLEQLMGFLGERGVCNLLAEGGGTLLGSLFEQGLVDKVAAFIAPVIIGGTGAPGPVGGVGPERLVDALRLARIRQAALPPDMLLVGYVK